MRDRHSFRRVESGLTPRQLATISAPQLLARSPIESPKLIVSAALSDGIPNASKISAMPRTMAASDTGKFGRVKGCSGEIC
ncbi:hypothetical protein TM233_12830 [Bradyrhizobium sp. TM233]|nr:hypothetical protein TM233_12830 [Bradyrhizobium sp. TM233]